MSSSLLLALLVTRSPTERLIQNILHNPFAGIHQLAWFDWAMLIPYFTVLIILSIYGLHRYDIIRTYFKHKKKKTTEPAKRFEHLPRVTIQLPHRVSPPHQSPRVQSGRAAGRPRDRHR